MKMKKVMLTKCQCRRQLNDTLSLPLEGPEELGLLEGIQGNDCDFKPVENIQDKYLQEQK